MTDQEGWPPPDRPSPPPPPRAPGTAWQTQPIPSGPAAPPAGVGGWQPPPPPPPPPGAPPGGGGSWQPPPPGPGYGYAPQAAQQTESLSTWSLVLGILSFVICPVLAAIAAIITGIKAKKSIDNSGGAKTGRTAATIGEVLGIVNVALSVLAIAGLVVLGLAASKHTRYTDLQAGDCYNRISSSSIFSGEVDRLACTQPHDTEVTGTFEASDTGSFPGADGFRALAEPRCTTLANQYLGTHSGTGLRIVWLAPKQSTWDSGTHTVVCGIQNSDRSRHTGSVRG